LHGQSSAADAVLIRGNDPTNVHPTGDAVVRNNDRTGVHDTHDAHFGGTDKLTIDGAHDVRYRAEVLGYSAGPDRASRGQSRQVELAGHSATGAELGIRRGDSQRHLGDTQVRAVDVDQHMCRNYE